MGGGHVFKCRQPLPTSPLKIKLMISKTLKIVIILQIILASFLGYISGLREGEKRAVVREITTNRELIEIQENMPQVVILQPKPQAISSNEITVENVINAINLARYDAGLPIFKHDAELDLVAHAKANDMIVNNYFAHVSPTGVKISKFIYEFKHNLVPGQSYAGENLARNFQQLDSLMQAWLNSPTHKAQIMGNYNQAGAAIKENLIVTVFANGREEIK